jgi:hypothetical protein
MTPEAIAALEEWERNATPGPWEVGDGLSAWLMRQYAVTSPHAREGEPVVNRGAVEERDARLIAAMRSHLPALLTIAKAARRVVEAHEDYRPGAYQERIDALDALAEAFR